MEGTWKGREEAKERGRGKELQPEKK